MISGKVNMVTYQPSYFDVTQNAWVTPTDQYYHRYIYDTKNRIKDVYTGRDSVMLYLFPEREAHYYYYTHGPLARTELGQLKVQGLDYAYTIQGWLKGVNPTQGGSLTNGTDTTQPFPVAQNAYGFSLHYYNGDYKAIGYTPQSSSVLGALGASAAPLYNGNIAAMAVNIPQLGSAKVYNYHYDQLNRIVALDAYNGLNASAGTFTPVSISDYQERTAYDPNGNILTYQRNGDAARLSMDNLSYYYKPQTNQLQKVTDAAADATTNYSLYNDIKQGQLDNNYQYDGIGNLTSDASEGISNIGWTVYGKISSITKAGAAINYTYDATGNRIIKSTASDTTVYVRDGSGNVMSVYVKKVGGSLAQTEMHIYGSSRLGMATQHMVGDTSMVLAGGFGTAIKSTFTRGEKFFELSNHLGNVLATITDRRMQNSYMGANVDYYTTDITAANDYYPFGMQMPARKYSSGSQYRYGFNGKENDNEVKGLGNQIDYGARVYDPRVGRFMSVDPLQKQYPMLTPYQFTGNNPVAGIDLDGREFLGAGWLVDKLSEGASKLGLTRTAGFINSYGHSLWIDPAYSATHVIKSAIEKDVKGVVMQMDPTPVSGTVSLYQIGKKALGGDKFAQGQFLGSLPAIYGGFKAFKAAKSDVQGQTTSTPSETINAQAAAANGGNETTQSVISSNGQSSIPNYEALYVKYKKNRPLLFKETITKTWESARQEDGNVYDPNTGELLTWDKSKGRYEQWHMGHKPGHEYRVLLDKLRKGEITEYQFKKEYNNAGSYQPESPAANMSHKYEQKSRAETASSN